MPLSAKLIALVLGLACAAGAFALAGDEPSGKDLRGRFFDQRRQYREEILAKCECRSAADALVLMQNKLASGKVSAFVISNLAHRTYRSLDTPLLYQVLIRGQGKLAPEAAGALRKRLDDNWSVNLPLYVSLETPFDPWDYNFIDPPTENCLCNDIVNRLLDTLASPERVYSDGHTAVEHRAYWEDAFRQFVAARITHGFREWDSTVYLHVIVEDAMAVYNCLPEGKTRAAASAFLDAILLNVARTLRGKVWTGPHCRVYNKPGYCMLNLTQHSWFYCMRWIFDTDWSELAPGGFRPNDPFNSGLLVSDYTPPAAILELPQRTDRYVSLEKTGPRQHPRGMGQNAFYPDRNNVCICREDREDVGDIGLVYNYLTPMFALGSVQNWGSYGAEWHMHCMPWNLVISTPTSDGMILSFTGGPHQSSGQGGYMTWGQTVDWTATIFQHKTVLFSQIRAAAQIHVMRAHPSGFLERPFGAYWDLAGFREPKQRRMTRIYIANSLGPLTEEKGWVMGENNGVCFAVRPARGGYSYEPQPNWIPGRVLLCQIWDDVVLLEVEEAGPAGGFRNFKKDILAANLRSDPTNVQYTALSGDRYVFRWKSDGEPTVNGQTPDYGSMRFDDPCIQSKAGSGRIMINTPGVRCELIAADPENIRRIEE